MPPACNPSSPRLADSMMPAPPAASSYSAVPGSGGRWIIPTTGFATPNTSSSHITHHPLVNRTNRRDAEDAEGRKERGKREEKERDRRGLIGPHPVSFSLLFR